MTFFMELDMSYYIQKTSSEFYSDQIIHVNPELCFFILVIENHFIVKYARAKLAPKNTPASAGGKKLKKVKVEGGSYDVVGDSTATNDQKKSFQPSKTENSLTKLMSETEPNPQSWKDPNGGLFQQVE